MHKYTKIFNTTQQMADRIVQSTNGAKYNTCYRLNHEDLGYAM